MPKGQRGPGIDTFKSNKSINFKRFVHLRPNVIQLKGSALGKYLI